MYLCDLDGSNCFEITRWITPFDRQPHSLTDITPFLAFFRSNDGAQKLIKFQESGWPNSLLTLKLRLYDLEDKMRSLRVPTLVINGDEDDPCLDAGLFMKRTIISSALVLLPRTGHLCNLEEPDLYNQICGDFMHRVEAGRWELRDPRSMTTAIISTPGK